MGSDGVVVDTGLETLQVRLLATGEPRHRLSVAGQAVTVVADGSARRIVEWDERSFRLQRTALPTVAEAAGVRTGGVGAGRLTAPMPGRVVKVAVADGQRVAPHQPLMVLEAMKMEHVVEAPHAGVVTEICVQVGEQVVSGAQLSPWAR